MPKPDEVVAEEPEATTEPTEAVAEGETQAADAPEVADEAEAEGATEEKGDDVDRRITEAVNKALEAQAAKLGEARKAAEASARIEAERDFYKLEVERTRNPKKEEPELKLPDGFDLLPEAAQRDYLEQKRAIAELRRRDAEREASINQMQRNTLAREIDGIVEDMKEDSDNFPGFSEVYPQIEEMGRTDPDFLRAVVANPKKWLRVAYRDLTAEKAPALAEKAYEEKLAKQRKAQTTRPSARDNGGTIRATSVDAALEKAWAEGGGGGDE